MTDIMSRIVYFVSDRTGITAETLGRALLSQFEGVTLEPISRPFVDTPDKAREVVAEINRSVAREQAEPLVFMTLVDPELAEIVRSSDGRCFDLFDTFIGPLEETLDTHSTHTAGRSHGMVDTGVYDTRMDAVNFALGADDGAAPRALERAEVILTGVSRTGKTPTALYLALQYGVYAANYPLTGEELERLRLPRALEPHRDRLFGLTIRPDRLQGLRSARRPGGRYADPRECRYEVEQAEAMFRQARIPFLDVTSVSIEEIATSVLHRLGLGRPFR